MKVTVESPKRLNICETSASVYQDLTKETSTNLQTLYKKQLQMNQSWTAAKYNVYIKFILHCINLHIVIHAIYVHFLSPMLVFAVLQYSDHGRRSLCLLFWQYHRSPCTPHQSSTAICEGGTV